MHNRKITAFVASLVIILSFPIYVLRHSREAQERLLQTNDEIAYTGTESCTECHKLENDLWLESDHARAMDTAIAETVLGDFNNAGFTSKSGITSRFYTRDGKYFVHTAGIDGKMDDYQLAYTFGYTPLQQYLVPMENGRFQCLNLAWNTEKGEWYDLVDTIYSGMNIHPDDWLYWTNNAQNWNGMCADCHSTDLKKGYDIESHEFHTTWSDINVGCEACHGPGEEHIKWAKLPDIARPMDSNFGLIVQTSNIETKKYVEQCARCHARRSVLDDFPGSYDDMLDYFIPQNISEPFYHVDGQILEEDYVYASFLQSRMYYNDVRCNDCHNVHSGKLVLDDNELCLQCHKKVEYDTYQHHFHKYAGEAGEDLVFGDTTFYVGEGALCVSCHMPGQYFMGVDFRRDHSMRIPRPDISLSNGTPNACNGCHKDESAGWAVEKINEWYGKNRKVHYGSIFARAGENLPETLDELIDIAHSDLYGTVVRSTALSQIASYGNEKSLDALEMAMSDQEAVVRHAGVQYYFMISQDDYAAKLGEMLHDPVRAVRIAAAFKLSALPPDAIEKSYKKSYKQVIEEYIKCQEYTADFPGGRHNLGIYYANTGEFQKAVDNYSEAIRIDDQFFPAKMNLALLYNQMGNNAQAEALLRDITEKHPDVHEAYYSLALLLAEMNNYEEAATYLEIAGNKMPDRARIFYNLALIKQFLKDNESAEKNLLNAIALEPGNLDFLYALADHYIKTGDIEKARPYAEKILSIYPQSTKGQGLMQYLNSQF